MSDPSLKQAAWAAFVLLLRARFPRRQQEIAVSIIDALRAALAEELDESPEWLDRRAKGINAHIEEGE
mgnify:FL=1